MVIAFLRSIGKTAGEPASGNPSRLAKFEMKQLPPFPFPFTRLDLTSRINLAPLPLLKGKARDGIRLALLALLATACQSAFLPTVTPISIDPALVSPSAPLLPSPTASLAPTELAWPTYQQPTLAPFPLSDSELQPTSAPIVGIAPASLNVPLALNEHDHFYFTRPVASADLKSLTPSQRYGVLQEAGVLHDAHLGVDLGLDAGTPVRAAAAGEIVWANYGLLYKSENYIDDPYGISVVIRHDFGVEGERLYTIYAHLSQAKVDVGERVERGQVIALSGNTGLSSGPHLHFEIRLGGNTIYFTRNPELWIAPPEGWGVIVGRVTTSRNVLLMNHLVEVRALPSRRLYTMYTYATEYKLLPDDYYDENFVLSDLPAGRYEIAIPYYGVWRRAEVEVRSGAVTYFHFEGTNEYSFDLPADPRPENISQ